MFSLEFHFKSKSALFSWAQPSSFPQLTHALMRRPHTATPTRSPLRPCSRAATPGRPPPAPTGCVPYRMTEPPSSILPSCGTARAGPPLPISLFHFGQKPLMPFAALFCSAAALGAEAHRHPLPPLSAKSVHRSRAPKHRHPCRICAEAPPSLSLFRELCCSSSPSQNGHTSSCSLSLSGPQEPSHVAVGRREASSPPETHRAVAALPPLWCRAPSMTPITPLLARRMLRGPRLLVPATSSHLGHR
jgi:hypothetical protein